MKPRDPDFEQRVRASFAKQTMMETLGARLEKVAAGEIVIAMPKAPHFLQQHGFVHGGAIGAIADSACGYAGFSLMAKGAGVLTVEYKINMLAPAAAPLFVATGKVVRAGRRITVAQAEVEAIDGAERRVIAIATATLMAIEDNDAIVD